VPQPVTRTDTHKSKYLRTIQLQITLSSVGSSVGIVTNCSLDDTKSGFNPRQRWEIFPSPEASGLLGPHSGGARDRPLNRISCQDSAWVKFKNEWTYTSIPSYVFMSGYFSTCMVISTFSTFTCHMCRFRWTRGLRRGFATAPVLGLRVRILSGAWMSVSCECCMLCRCSSLHWSDHPFRGVLPH